MADGSFPAQWKCSVTEIIPKEGKDDYTDPNTYQPIVLLSRMVKLFELVRARQLTGWSKKKDVLADGLGVQKGVGTEDTLVLFDTWVWKKWQEMKFFSRLFLDVKSA